MSQFDKMKEKILRRPTANNISPKELQSFLEHYGFVLKRVRGSHYIYAYKDKQHVALTIPMHMPVKPAYIDQIREMILEIEEEA